MLNFSIVQEINSTKALQSTKKTNLIYSLINELNNEQNLNEIYMDNYDYTGALVYLISIILFYSISILAIIRIQTKGRNDYYDYDDDDDHNYYRPESVLRRMKSENTTRQALEDLRNPEIRKKLWSMYKDHLNTGPFNTKNKNDLKIVETKKIQAIERKLNQMNKNVPGTYSTIDSSITQSIQRPALTKQFSFIGESTKKRFVVTQVDEKNNVKQTKSS